MFFWSKKHNKETEEKEYQFRQNEELDPYVWDSARLVVEHGRCSVGTLQRAFKIGFDRASRIIEQLCKIGVVGEENGYKPRNILVSEEELELLFKELKNRSACDKKTEERIKMYDNQFDYMTGEDFEMYVAIILKNTGYINVQLTKGSGDQGVDILAEKDGIKYAFQCKRYDKPVGNKAVQEVFAGKFFYHCHVAIVVTNNYFTQSAKELAHENGVVLWDRDKLNNFLHPMNMEVNEDISVLKTQETYRVPLISFLKRGGRLKITDEELRENAIKIQRKMGYLGINVTVANVTIGPRFATYEIQLGEGVSVNQICGILDDIKLTISAKNLFVEIPILGKSTIGIVAENDIMNILQVRNILESKEFQMSPSKLSVAIGRDIFGNIIVEDIAQMSNLLIGGTTGSGKTVLLNVIIMSIIYKATPDEVKMIMIDTKGTNSGMFNGIPHLIIPVATDVPRALGALKWCTSEIKNRYNKFSSVGAKNLKDYNCFVARECVLPQILVFIDDLYDLMNYNKEEVEELIVQITRLSRNVGVYLAVSTQYPSVNVITDSIKSNMLSRIAFNVFSSVDSRIILDESGAEELLGDGDMFFKKQGWKKPIRVQGAYVSDKEILDVVEFLKEHNKTT